MKVRLGTLPKGMGDIKHWLIERIVEIRKEAEEHRLPPATHRHALLSRWLIEHWPTGDPANDALSNEIMYLEDSYQNLAEASPPPDADAGNG